MAGEDDSKTDHIDRQIQRAGLPIGGSTPFIPRLGRNRRGEQIIEKATIQGGPWKGKKGYVDSQGRIWIRDRAHGSYPDHWDVQENGGTAGRFRVGDDGEPIP
jgi:hypothetical protein